MYFPLSFNSYLSNISTIENVNFDNCTFDMAYESQYIAQSRFQFTNAKFSNAVVTANRIERTIQRDTIIIPSLGKDTIPITAAYMYVNNGVIDLNVRKYTDVTGYALQSISYLSTGGTLTLKDSTINTNIGYSPFTFAVLDSNHVTITNNSPFKLYCTAKVNFGQNTGSVNNSWGIGGNIANATNYIGTNNNQPLIFRVSNTKAGRVDNGNAVTILGGGAGSTTINAATYNTLIGGEVGGNISGSFNTAVGGSAMFNTGNGVHNNAFGYQALFNNTTGAYNTANGDGALYNNKTGSYLVAFGVSAGRSDTSGLYNTYLGYQTGYSNRTGSQNTYSGMYSGYTAATTSNNTGFGYNTLFNNVGANNTAFGQNAGANITTGSNNIALGNNAQVPTATASNQLSIGNWIYGVGGLIGINTTTPQYKLDIDANTGSTGNPIRLQGLVSTTTADSVLVYKTANAGVVKRMSLAQLINGTSVTVTNPSTGSTVGYTAGTNK